MALRRRPDVGNARGPLRESEAAARVAEPTEGGEECNKNEQMAEEGKES